MGSRKKNTELNTVTGLWKGKQCKYIANQIIVSFSRKHVISKSYIKTINTIVSTYPHLKIKRKPNQIGLAVFILQKSDDIPKLARNLSKRDDIEYAEPDFVTSVADLPNDNLFNEQWALRRIRALPAWHRQTGNSNGVIIGIVDSGISLTVNGGLNHTDLDDPNRFILGNDFVDGGSPRDLHSHGTHVAGIAAAMTNNSNGIAGTNWHNPVRISRVFNAAGRGSTSDVIWGFLDIIDFANKNGRKAVINFSGGTSNDSKAYRDACQELNVHGMLLCAATGNDNAAVNYPAAYSLDYDAVIAVGATNENDVRANFSNFGPEVTVVAPGTNILSTTPTYAVTSPGNLNYDEKNGTSMATPFVTGLCSLLWSQNPTWTNLEVRERITSTARKLGSTDFDNQWGYGLIDSSRALNTSGGLESYLHLMMQ